MLTGQLIALLQKLPEDMEVRAFSASGYTYLGAPQVHLDSSRKQAVVYGTSPALGELVELVFTEEQMEFIHMAVLNHIEYSYRENSLHYLHHKAKWDELQSLVEAKLKRGKS